MRHQFQVYSDPSQGHRWVKVPIAILVELDIHEKITFFSYMRGVNAYLEEFQDLGTFVATYWDEFGYNPTLDKKPQSDCITSYSPYGVQGAEASVLTRCLGLKLQKRLKGRDLRVFEKLKHKLLDDSRNDYELRGC